MGEFRPPVPQVLGQPGGNISQGGGRGGQGGNLTLLQELPMVSFKKGGGPPGGAYIDPEGGPLPPMGRFNGLSARIQGKEHRIDRKSTRLNSSHVKISYAVFCLKKKK